MAIARSILASSPPPGDPRLITLYRSAMLELAARAEEHLIRNAAKISAESYRRRLLIREIEQILMQIDEGAAYWIAENIPEAYARGVRTAGQGLKEIGAGTGSVIDPKVHQEAVQVLVEDGQVLLAESAEYMGRQYRRMVRRTQLKAGQDQLIKDRVALGIAEGKARREVSREITQGLIDNLKEKPLVINGRSYDPRKYAEMVARTMTVEAQTAGTVNRMLDTGHDLVMVSAHGAEDGCSFYEGKVFSISGTSDTYPGLDALPNGGPPFHPNCRHTVVPYVDKFASGAEKRRAEGVPDETLNTSYNEVEKLYRKQAA